MGSIPNKPRQLLGGGFYLDQDSCLVRFGHAMAGRGNCTGPDGVRAVAPKHGNSNATDIFVMAFVNDAKAICTGDLHRFAQLLGSYLGPANESGQRNCQDPADTSGAAKSRKSLRRGITGLPRGLVKR